MNAQVPELAMNFIWVGVLVAILGGLRCRMFVGLMEDDPLLLISFEILLGFRLSAFALTSRWLLLMAES